MAALCPRDHEFIPLLSYSLPQVLKSAPGRYHSLTAVWAICNDVLSAADMPTVPKGVFQRLVSQVLTVHRVLSPETGKRFSVVRDVRIRAVHH
ncbi:hypothetical protein [Streptomyces sp. NPDC002205]|uniref:hypothetical protein n=1 Tax=Streptomyces sp. NPDC002205 TaxID=3154411 RepID=UPI00331DEFB5